MLNVTGRKSNVLNYFFYLVLVQIWKSFRPRFFLVPHRSTILIFLIHVKFTLIFSRGWSSFIFKPPVGPIFTEPRTKCYVNKSFVIVLIGPCWFNHWSFACPRFYMSQIIIIYAIFWSLSFFFRVPNRTWLTHNYKQKIIIKNFS